MKNRKNHLNPMIKTNHKGLVEDTTEYGEYIASFDAWMTPEEQKRRAKHLEDLEEESDEEE